MHMLKPVFLPLDEESAPPEKLAEFMGDLDKKGQTGLRLIAASGPDVRKVSTFWRNSGGKTMHHN